MSNSTDSPIEDTKRSFDLAKTALTKGSVLAALAMRGAPTRSKFLVYACYLFFTLGLLALVVPPYETVKQAIVLGLIAIFFLIAILLATRRYNALVRDTDRSVAGFSIQLRGPALAGVREALRDATRYAFEILSQRNSQIRESDIRANIFIPYRNSPNDDNASALAIYPGLHVNMDDPKELGIKFELEKGATGRVFTTGIPQVARRVDGDKGDWEDIFVMTPSLEATVHKDLKWVISIPLTDRSDQVLAVMNIDGLHHRFPYDDLYDCLQQVEQRKVIIQKFLEQHVVQN